MFAYSLGDGAELRTLEPWHAEELLGTVDASRDHLAAAIPIASCVFTLDDTRKYLRFWADARAQDAGHLFGVWLDGALVGCIQLFGFSTAGGMCEIGVWMAKDVEGRGLAAAACRAVIDWAIRVRGIRRVQWTNNTANTRSSALAQRLGMTREGVLRSAGILTSWAFGFVKEGVRWDNEMWSVLAEEWPPADAGAAGRRPG